MGCNYYAHKIPTEQEESKYKEYASNGDWHGLNRELNELEPVHIGKSSVGWQFIFNHNDKQYYDTTAKSIDSFLSKCEIRDEYGRLVSKDDFWKKVKGKESGVVDQYSFVSDGLVFSNYTDFS